MYGQVGNDRLEGGDGPDDLFGGSGADHLFGGNGDDDLDGGPAADRLFGGNGDDLLRGGAGVFDDRLYGDNGNDRLEGGPGDDLLDGGIGDDLIFGHSGNDKLIGGFSNDRLFGGSGDDMLFGGIGTGRDMLFGDSGNDILFGQGGFGNLLVGGPGDDMLCGGGAANRLEGGQGNDLLIAGDSNAQLFGGPGVDSYEGTPYSTVHYPNLNSDDLTIVRRSLSEYEISFMEGDNLITETTNGITKLTMQDGRNFLAPLSNRPVPGNRPPVAADFVITPVFSTELLRFTFNVIDKAVDPDGDHVALTNFIRVGGMGPDDSPGNYSSASVRGREVVYSTERVSSRADYTDVVTYEIQDSRGGTAKGTITIDFVDP